MNWQPVVFIYGNIFFMATVEYYKLYIWMDGILNNFKCPDKNKLRIRYI